MPGSAQTSSGWPALLHAQQEQGDRADRPGVERAARGVMRLEEWAQKKRPVLAVTPASKSGCPGMRARRPTAMDSLSVYSSKKHEQKGGRKRRTSKNYK